MSASNSMGRVAEIMQTAPFVDSPLPEYVDLRKCWAEFAAFVALEQRIAALEEKLTPTKVHGETWSIPIGEK